MRKKIIHKLIAIILIVGLNGMALSHIGYTKAYYNDVESSGGNAFTAGMLDFILSELDYESLIGSEAVGEKTAVTVAMPVDGSMDMQYKLTVSTTSLAFDPLCNALVVEAKKNGLTQYLGSFSGLLATVATTTEFGTWEFRFDLPPTALAAHGDKCVADARFYAWRAEIADPEDSGYDDEEILSFDFTARMVVLNEIFANPNGGVAPKDREYVELYNNGNTPVDVLGWQISEIAGSTETFHPIVASGATPTEMQPYGGASTMIAPGGYLVLEFGGASSKLNNDGDTVRLYDNVVVLLDTHAYPSTAPGKAHVRFPDGIGFWIDPEPTPGGENTVSIQDLVLAGFDDETIRQILEMVALTGAPIPLNEPLQLLEAPVDEVIIEVATSTSELEIATSTEMILEEATSTEPILEETASSTPEAVPEEEPVAETEEVIEAREEDILPPEPVFEETPVIVEESVPVEPTPTDSTPSIDSGQASSPQAE